MTQKFFIGIMLRIVMASVFLLTIPQIYSQEHAAVSGGLGQQPQNDSLYGGNQATYFIPRYVIGTGGVLGAFNSNQIHSATAGETIAGGMQNSSHFLFSGFWQPGLLRSVAIAPDDELPLPESYELYPNYPNPFNPHTTIRYDLSHPSVVTVEVLNIIGQRIRLLQNEQIQRPGMMQIVWDGLDDLGKMSSSGIYLYRITAHKVRENSRGELLFQKTRKMLLVK